MLESITCLFFGVGLAFGFSWPIACCGLALAPFIIAASAASAKIKYKTTFGTGEEDKDETRDELILGDTIMNYKVVASFGNDQQVLKEYEYEVLSKVAGEVKDGKSFGCSWGVSQAVSNGVFGVLYLCSALMMNAYPDYAPL